LKIFQSLAENTKFGIRIVPIIISLTLLFSVLIIAATPPATGYELSIYEVYPTFLWVTISINIFFSIYTIIQSCDSQSKNSYYGYFSILLIETIILFLPIIRGYYTMNRADGDMFHHIFSANQILNSGYLSILDMYPIMHIWLSVWHNFLPDLIILTIILSIVFFILYILFLYILGKTIFGTNEGGVFLSIFGIPLIFSYSHYAYYPFLFALFIIPLILYLYQKIIQNSRLKNALYICLILLSLFIVFCHPIITIFLIIIFSIFTFYELIKRRKTLSKRSNIVAINIVAIVSITFLFWIFQFRYILNTLRDISFALLGQEKQTSIIEYQTNFITTSNASIWYVIDRFIKIYGPVFFYFSLSFLFILYIIYQYYRNRKINENELIYSLQFCVATCVGIVLITGYFVIFEPIRAMAYGLIFATIISGMFFYWIYSSTISEKRKTGIITSISVIITIVCMLTILTLYPSPWIGNSGSELTYGNKNGLDWILKYRNAELPIVSETGPIWKYSTNYYESMNMRIDQGFVDYPWKIPSNFGYDTNRTVGDSFAYLPDKNVYMTTSESMKLAPYAVPADRRNRLKSFTNSGFIRLKNDQSVNLVFSNDQFSVWKIEIP
jgi:hypothetical protein